MTKHTAFIILCFWLVMTNAWWILAFWPLSATSPEWLAAAKLVCFGSALDNGLPNAGGWLMLTAAPLSMLVALLVAWGDDLKNSFKVLFLSTPRKALLVIFVCLFIAQSIWLVSKVRAGMIIANQDYTANFEGPLPSNYPIRDIAAPDF